MSRQWTAVPVGKSPVEVPPRPLAAARHPRPASTGNSGSGHEFSRLPVLPARHDVPPPGPLPEATPAWSAGGAVHLAPQAMFADSAGRQEMLRHEAIHARQQVSATADNSAPALHRAELAAAADIDLPPGVGIPEALAYPPQNFSPWQRVWIGHPGIVGEVEAAGVKVRLFMEYAELAPVKGYWDYFCGPHDGTPIPDRVKEMQGIANLVGSLNAAMPAGRHRVDMVVIGGDPSNDGYRDFQGKGLVVLSRDELLARSWSAAIRHEVSHGIFEFHGDGGKATVAPAAPDNFALSVADLFNRLRATREVPLPRKAFAAETPRLAVAEGERGIPAGLVMVHDTLWAGSGGHPQDNVSEFFASANAAYLTDQALLRRIIDFYVRHDPALRDPGKELLALLAAVPDPKAYGSVKAPRAKDDAAATIKAAGGVPEFKADHYAFSRLLDPDSMPAPGNFYCQPKGGEKTPTVDELLDFEGGGKNADKPEAPARPAPDAGKTPPSAKDKQP